MEQTLWNTSRETEMKRPLTTAEEMKRKTVVSREKIAEDRLWNKRPDGIPFKMPTITKADVIYLMQENVRCHCPLCSEGCLCSRRTVCILHIHTKQNNATLLPGWMVTQVSFIAGVWSLNEEELKKTLEFFKVPQGSMESIRSKLG